MKQVKSVSKTKKVKLIRESRVSAGDIDATSAFMKNIRRGRFDRKLTREEEIDLASRWLNEGDEAAKQKLMAHNQLLVYTIARSVCKDPSKLQDFVDEGMIGLSIAIDHFKPEKGNRLSTVAYPWIKKVLIEYLYGDGDNALVRRPHNYQIGSNINKINAKFFAEHGRYPEKDELQALLKSTRNLSIPEDELNDVIMNSMNSPVSKSDDDDDAEYGTVGEFAARTSSLNSYETQIENDYLVRRVDQLLRSVDARTRDILQRKFALGPYDYEQDDDQIADELGLTKTRIQQLVKAAYAKLRNS